MPALRVLLAIEAHREQRGHGDDEGPDGLQADGEPPVGRNVPEVRAQLAVQVALVLRHEALRLAEGAHGARAVQRLPKVRVDG
eukprot:86707-Prorocentrum_minimum.AAC.3